MFSKYRNRKTTVRNITFDSKLESHIYLKLLEFSKKYPIAFDRQPEYVLIDGFMVNGNRYRKTVYKGDFNVVINGKIYTIDVKSPASETQVFKLKRKLFAQKYGREIITVKSVAEFEKWFKKMIREEGLSLYE
jgi:hypothetical protein